LGSIYPIQTILTTPIGYAPVIIEMNASSGLTLDSCLPILGAMAVCGEQAAAIKVFIKISENRL
jgi:hypothetical protein